MKHQVLSRVFAVVLAILCMLLLVTGVRGFGKAEEQINERRAYEEKFAGRIENYVALEAELAGSISYDEARAALDQLIAQHERDASQHRTDTALHTAETGGNIMGADLIWEALPELKGAKQELEEAKWQLAQKEAVFKRGKAGIETLVRVGTTAGGEARAKVAQLAGELNTFLTENPMPTVPEQPQPPTAPLEVEDPGEFTLPEPQRGDYVTAEPPPEPPEDAPEEELEAYRAALAEYEALLAEQEAAYCAALEEYEARKAAYEYQKMLFDTQPERFAKYAEELAQYEKDLAAYEAAQAELRAWNEAVSAIVAPYINEVEALAADLEEAIDAIQALANEVGESGVGNFNLPSLGELLSMTPDQLVRALPGLVEQLSGAFGQITGALGTIENALAQARAQLVYAEEELKKAEAMLNGQLEMIWLNLGELEKEAEGLAEDKERLDQEASVLNKKLLENEALKDLTNRRNTARQLLMNVPEVRAEFNETGDLPTAAEHYLEAYRARTQELDEGLRRVYQLAVLAAVAGLLEIPGAFELLKKRFFLLAPVLLCIMLAAGCEWLHVKLGEGQQYVALFTAIFAALQLLIVLPKRKTVV